MGKEESNTRKKGKTVMVGVKLATASREVLTWTLIKVARPGDHVIALHVVTSPTDSAASQWEQNKTDQQLSSTFDAVVGVYAGFCNLKQVDFQVKISRGSVVKKVLLEETKLCDASKLILGTSKRHAIAYPISLAKYCAKRLPSTSSVLVVDHGKVVMEKEGSQPVSGAIGARVGVLSGVQGKARSLVCKVPKKIGQEALFVTECPSDSKTSAHNNCDSGKQDGIPNTESNHGEYTRSPVSVLNNCTYTPFEMDAFRSCLACTGASALGSDDKEQLKRGSEGSDSEGLSSTDSFHTAFGTSDRFTLVEEERGLSTLPTQPTLPTPMKFKRTTSKPVSRGESPGWPLLHRAISLNKVPGPQSIAREMSVVEWALKLPNRRREVTGEHPTNTEVTQESSNDEKGLGKSNNGTLREMPQCDQIQATEEEHPLTGRLKLLCEKKNCKEFTYEVLQSATSNFSAENLVGRGGCSRVYRGVLPDGQSVAVKFLNVSVQTEQELLLEVEIITALQHKNIISLIGYCVEGQDRLLVYNFVPRGNLEENLHVGKGKPVVLWKDRLKVAIGVAEALDYLHDGCSRPVIHRDVKSSNILLFEDFEPQLSDFGLAKWASTTSSHIICADVVGTFGYLAPEYFMYGKINEKTDIYSFGVVLLELITGKQPIDTRNPKCQESLVTWARPLLEDGSVAELVDPHLEDVYDAHEMQRMILAAALCVRQGPQFRPRMRRILNLLRGEGDNLTHWARHQLTMSKDMDNYADDTEGGNYGNCDIRSHLTLAMLGVDDDVLSLGSTDHSVDLMNSNKAFEDYLGGRYSRSSSLE